MGSDSDNKWINAIRDAILGRSDVSDSTEDGDGGTGEEVRATDGDNPPVQSVPKAPQPGETNTENVSYNPPAMAEVPPPMSLGPVSDGTAMMYIQTCFWVASYVKLRAERGDFTQDQLIEQFGVNVRRCIDPNWKADS